MSDTAKIIRLEPEIQRHVRARLARLPAAVHSIHDSGKKRLANDLVAYFDAVDDALFALADRAKSNQEQNLFFDSMREVRMQRKGMERRFFGAVDEAFARLVGDDARDAGINKDTDLPGEALSLVHSGDLEQLVALESTIARVASAHRDDIHSISSVLEKLMASAVTEQNNPLGPSVVCHAGMAQIKRLDIDIKAKLVLFKLFDKHVISLLPAVYQGLLEELTAMGIKAPALRKPQRSSENTATAQVPSKATSRENHKHPRSDASPAAADRQQLLDLLSFVQRLPVNASNRNGVDVERVLATVQHHRGGELVLGPLEKETMRLVQMLFQFILRDNLLAEPMKALICRMQVPVLKVALLDQTFLTNKGHPARRLLNEMSAIASQWQNPRSDKEREEPLFRFMKAMIERILREFDRKCEIFQESLADFTSFVQKEQRRSAVLEKRTIDAEDGKARAEEARRTVASEIELRTMAHEVPMLVRTFIDGPWSNVLFVTGLKYGFGSAEWAEQLKVLTDLVWSVQPWVGQNDRQKLIRLVPDVIQRMRKGLDSISFNPFEVSELFAGLEDIHLARIRGLAPPGEAGAAETAPPGRQQQTAAPAKVGPAEARNSVPPKAAQEEAQAQETLSELPEAEGRAEGARSAPQPEPQPSVEAAVMAPGDPHMLLVQGFSQGAWFDFNENGEAPLRCRLAAFIKPTGKYIFVNRTGVKVAERTQVELAMALKLGHLRSLDNSMLFDRALESVVTGLRKSQSSKPLGDRDE